MGQFHNTMRAALDHEIRLGTRQGRQSRVWLFACLGHFKFLTVKVFFFFSLQLEEKLKEQTEELKKADNKIK